MTIYPIPEMEIPSSLIDATTIPVNETFEMHFTALTDSTYFLVELTDNGTFSPAKWIDSTAYIHAGESASLSQFIHVDPAQVFPASIQYTITPKSKSCTGDSHNLEFNALPSQDFFVSSVLTINGDNKNDEWFVLLGPDHKPEAYEMSLFNSRGGMVKRWNDLNFRWDGENVSEGNYYYIIKEKATGKAAAKGGLHISRQAY